MNNELPKLDNSNLWDRTYNILKERIIFRQFKPDEKLSIPDLADQLGVSRTPVRDALNRLEMEGMVITKSKVGTFVVAIDEELINCIMDTRLMIEFWVVDKIAGLPKQQLHAAISNMEKLHNDATLAIKKSGEIYYQSDFNLKFHLEFIKLGGNKKNIEIYTSIMNYRLQVTVPKLVPTGEANQAVFQHGQILKALKEESREDMRMAIQEHLEDSKVRIIQKIRNGGGKI